MWWILMVVIILLTAWVEKKWLDEHNFVCTVQPTPTKKILYLIFTLVPVLNTIFGICCAIVLFLMCFGDSFLIETLEKSDSFTKFEIVEPK